MTSLIVLRAGFVLQMVDLTAKNMSSTNSKNRKEWGEELKKVFQGEDEAFAVGYGYCYYCWCLCFDLDLMLVVLPLSLSWHLQM